MEVLKTHQVSDIFTLKCDCFDNISFEYPPFYDEENGPEYLQEVTNKTNEYINEVLKHTNKNSVEIKPCYRKDHTNGLAVLKSYKKHKKTLNVLRQVLNSSKEKEAHKVTFLNGRQIRATVYLKLFEQTVSNNISRLRVYSTSRSEIDINLLIASIRSHQSSLTVLKNLIEYNNGRQNSQNVERKLEDTS